MANLGMHIEIAIGDLQTLTEFVQENSDLLTKIPAESREAIKLVKSEPVLRKMKFLLSLRDSTSKVLRSYVENEGQSEVEFNGVPLPFESARILSLQSHLSCLWSLYDLIAGFGRTFLHKNTGQENCNLKRMFLKTGDRSTKLAMEILTDTLTNNFGLEIDLCYSVRNIFLHTSGLELDDVFVDNKTGTTAFILKNSCIEQILKGMDESILRENVYHPLRSETDLLKIIDTCQDAIDGACVFIVKVSTRVLDGLLHSFMP